MLMETTLLGLLTYTYEPIASEILSDSILLEYVFIPGSIHTYMYILYCRHVGHRHTNIYIFFFGQFRILDPFYDNA